MKVLKSKPTQNTHPNILMRYYQDTKWFAILTKASLCMAEDIGRPLHKDIMRNSANIEINSVKMSDWCGG